MIAVERIAGLGILTDLGRPGYARWGVTPSGAFDVGAHLAANAVLGNAPGAATIEQLLGPLVLRARRACVLAVTGAEGDVLVDALAVASGRPFTLLPGRALTIGAPREGLRRYVAVRGGFDVPRVLGSRSRDTLAGLGPAPLAVGDVLAVGQEVAGPLRPPPGTDLGGAVGRGGTDAAVALDVRPGPRPEMFVQGAFEALAEHVFTVSQESDRVAVRLLGAAPDRAGAAELPSEGLVPGAVQVPPSGSPVVMGPDHPLTGGYPVLAVLTRDALDRLAQLRPGTRVRLVPRPT
ncbi:biotin-dependent carboxyltransferase family protein [Litorihabitans aurantiacus]|uniref:Carboxyltransferase domain-containing protein n=1 Tax=Litorihabitans aurantiacus TaxID=1930061 RepID=A0AA37UWS6_9MICO|nr:biotin-dependent carboxyltransferase family protein [Litorihabitans aurantiacus]GMA30742.1 hypothetical protein GCM10025875_07340 [Litorihabitans aurantiacus]